MKQHLTAAFVALATQASAGGGIDFREMPSGCQWVVRHSDGQSWLET